MHDSFETGGQNLFQVLAPNLLLQLLSLWDDIFKLSLSFLIPSLLGTKL